MAEALGTAASIIAVLNLAGTVVKYLTSVHNAPKERENVFREISSITSVLFLVQGHSERGCNDEESTLSSSARSLGTPGGPLEQFKAALETLAYKFSPRGVVKRVGRVLLWPFEKGEIAELLLSLERLKTRFLLALQSDNLDLSRATKSAVDKLSGAMEWLRIGQDDMDQKHQDIFALYQEGTCSWFMESEAVTGWLEGDEANHMLWCPGDPGAGKTVMTSVVIEHTRTRFPDEEVGIALAYCHYNDPDANTSISIISSLVRQLAIRGDTLHHKVDELYRKMTKGKKSTRPSLKDLQGLLLSLASSFERTYVFVDGIDECEKKDRTVLLSALKDLAKLKNGRIRVFATSRPHAQDIQRAFDDPCATARLNISATESDIETFVRNQLEGNEDLLELIETDGGAEHETSLQDRIISSTARQASGMFLMATLQVERLSASDSVKEVNNALTSMPTGLFDMYAESLERMAKQPETRYRRGLRILAWISRSARPLTVDELLHALVAEDAGDATPQPRQLDKSALVQPRFIVDVCAGLVAIEPKSRRVRLVHATAMEYLDQLNNDKFTLAEENISRACLTYLSFDEIASGPSPSDDEMSRRLEKFPFLQYSARSWGWHLQKAQSLRLHEVAAALLKNDMSSMSISQASHLPSIRFPNYSQLYPKKVNVLHIAAHFGLDEFARVLLADGNVDLNSEDSFGWMALHRAAENGHVEIVRLLLEKQCDPNASAQFGGTPLHRAAKNSHVEVAQLLLDHKGQVDAEDNYGGTPLHRAARNGHVLVVRALLTRGANVSQYYNFQATLRLMKENGLITAQVVSDSFQSLANWHTRDETAVRVEAELTARDRLRGGTALHEAAGSGSEELVRLLLEEGHAKIDATDNFGGTALHRAARRGHESVVGMLLERGAFIDCFCEYGTLARELVAPWTEHTNGRLYRFTSRELDLDSLLGGTPLHEAAANRHENAVRLLLKNGADPNLAGMYGGSSLNRAARNGHAAIVQVLLQHGADVDQSKQTSMDLIGGTALHEAAEYGHEAAALLLLEGGANVNRGRGLDDITPLCLAAKGGHEALASLLLDWGAEVDMKSDSTGHTALSVAAENGHAAVVQLLLRHGAAQIRGKSSGRMPGMPDVDGYRVFTPLWLAVARGHFEAARVLLQHGADANCEGSGLSSISQPVLAVAIELGSLQTVQELLAKGANPNGESSMLHCAVEAAGKAEKADRDAPESATEAQVVQQALEGMVYSLLQSGADVSAEDGWWKNTALHAAAKGGHERMVALLLANGANINATNKAEETPLYHAVELGRVSTIRFLLDAGARDDVGVSPLYAAAQGGSEAAAQILLEHGAEISESSGVRQKALLAAASKGVTILVRALLDGAEDVEATLEGSTSLTHASRWGHDAIIRLLLERGAQLETAESSTDRTPVLLAAVGGHESAALMLLEKGARPDSVDKETGRSLLSWASGQGMEKLVRQLLDRNVDANAKDAGGRPPIAWAASNGHATIVQLLLAFCDFELLLEPLCFAAERGQVALVRLLADAGASIDGEGLKDDNYPIVRAAKGSHTAVVRELVSRGANTVGRSAALVSAASNGDYESALVLLEAGDGVGLQSMALALSAAVAKNHLRIVQMLLSKGVETGTTPDTGTGLLLQATRLGHEDMVRTLLDAGVRDDIKTALHTALETDRPTMARRLLTVWGKVDWTLVDNRTLLGRAAEKGYEDIVQSLLELGADPDEEEPSLNHPTAVSYAAGRGHVKMVELLLKKMDQARDPLRVIEMLLPGAEHERIATILVGAAPEWDALEGHSSKLMMTASFCGHERVVRLMLDKGMDPNVANDRHPIHAATLGQSLPVVRLLLERGAGPNTRDIDIGQTALSFAAEFASDSIIRLLLEHNADLESGDDADGSTPLLWAAKKGNEGAVRLLLQKGALVNAENSEGLTPLLAAATCGHGATVKALLDYGAHIRASNADGSTALHYAAMGGFRRTARILLDHPDVEPWLADKSGKTPRDRARSNGHEALAKFLEAHPKDRE